MFMFKKLYIKFILILLKYHVYFIVLFTILYIIFLRYIYFIFSVENIISSIPLEESLKELKKEPKVEIEIKDYKPSYDYYDYKPSYNYYDYEDNLSPLSIGIIGISLAVMDSNPDIIPEFTISNNDVLSDTIVTNPPLLDNHYPFETPVDLVIPEHKEVELIIHGIYNSDLQKDMFHSIYSPSYKGTKTLNHDQIFNLHLEIVKIVSTHLSTINEDLSQDEIIEHVKQVVREYMIQYNIFKSINIQNLKNTEHFLNLLIGEMMINSMFASDSEKRLLHIIARSLVFYILNHLESGSTNFKDYRIDAIISRFLHFDDDNS